MKQFYKKTLSLCPECLREIPATIYIDDHRVVMEKVCKEHGLYEGLVENDATFYLQLRGLPYRDIYQALFVEVTSRCNMACKFCYYPVQNKPDPSIDEIEDHCRRFQFLAPFLITGGEPTVRDDLPELIQSVGKYGKVCLLTNGLRLADEKYLDGLLSMKELVESGCLNVVLSLHSKGYDSPEHRALKLKALESIFSRGLKVESVNFTVSELSELDDVLEFIDQYPNKVKVIRIRTALNAGATTTVQKTLFNSDKYRYLLAKCQAAGVPFGIIPAAVIPDHATKVCYLNCHYRTQHVILACWYDKTNIDLDDIKGAPYLKGKDNQVRQFLYSVILNERKTTN
jgi:uncharacterized radical SAM superfamily Fe-S cluster-containing enzyme